MGRKQTVVESLHHRHREDHKAVLVGLKVAKQGVGNIPDDCGLLLYIDAHLGNFVVAHAHSLPRFYTIRLIIPSLNIFGNKSIPVLLNNSPYKQRTSTPSPHPPDDGTGDGGSDKI